MEINQRTKIKASQLVPEIIFFSNFNCSEVYQIVRENQLAQGLRTLFEKKQNILYVF